MVLGLIFAVHHEHTLWFLLKGVHPPQQTFSVRMAGHAGELAQFCLHLNRFTEQFYRRGTFQQGAAQRAHRLIAHEQNGALRPPQIVLEVVADAACLAHTAGREDDLWHAVCIDHAGFITGHRDAQPREGDRINAFFQQSAGVRIKAVRVGIFKDAGRLDGKRAVNVHREVAVPLHKALFLDLTDKVEHLLRAAHRKAGNDHIAAPVKGALQDLRQLAHIVRLRAVAAVAVGRFHKGVVRLFDVSRILDDGLIQIADITGEYQLGRGLTLGDPKLYAGRAKQMAHIHKAGFNARCKLEALLIGLAHKQLHGCFSILHSIHRFHRFCAGALALAVFPLRFKFLNMGRVPQHDAAQLHRGVRGIDLAAEAVAHQQRQHTGMVDVCMGGQHPVDLAGCHRDGLVLVYVLPLLHAAVDQKALPSRFDQSAAAGDLMVRAQKCDLHKNTSGFISSVPLV